MIALQINTWNGDRLANIEFHSILTEVYNDLMKDRENLTALIKENDQFINKLILIRQHGADMKSDSLMLLISDIHGVTNFLPANSGYNKLNKFSDTKKLNDSLISPIIIYYTQYYESLNNTNFEFLSGYSINKFRDYLIDYGFPIQMNNTTLTLPNLDPFAVIMGDPKFIGILRNFEYNRRIQGHGFKDALDRVNQNIAILQAHFI